MTQLVSSPMGWKFVSYSSDDNSSALKTHQPQGVGSKKYMIATSDAEEVYMDGTDMVHTLEHLVHLQYTH